MTGSPEMDALTSPFDLVLGTDWVDYDPDRARARVELHDDLLQPEARGVARHRGRTSWVWAIDVVDAQERLCALAKVTVAVRPAAADA